ncbi:MAG: NAD(P)/FAD-dependent oxidoreductase, partial [Cyanobacteria bacterium]|nr:NAD(P)/FAD-dependent oxidoreductase [Cyanobacteriota bacterium]
MSDPSLSNPNLSNPSHSEPVVIIGAGLSGLTCGHYLAKANIPFLILEASSQVGGRVKTENYEGFLLDYGFQVFLTSYPEAQKVLNYEALDLKP